MTVYSLWVHGRVSCRSEVQILEEKKFNLKNYLFFSQFYVNIFDEMRICLLDHQHLSVPIIITSGRFMASKIGRHKLIPCLNYTRTYMFSITDGVEGCFTKFALYAHNGSWGLQRIHLHLFFIWLTFIAWLLILLANFLLILFF